ncbi:FAD-dependent oxidoreductase [Arthrobacter sp. NPDC056493]|uniref:FAD-dependent oxidoreductase n=1 Tax=Arthrobacter sp. NPDC056493 TaxID=3345839 RepID=UPI00366D3112
MEPSALRSDPVKSPGSIAILGAGPAGLVLAIALARRGLSATVIERDIPPDIAPRFNPDRSYTIDISGHGLKALRHIDAVTEFDRRMFRFKGLKIPGRGTEEWTLPGWTGSRGDILRALSWVLGQYTDRVALEFETNVESVDPVSGSLTSRQRSGEANVRSFDLLVGADGAGSAVRSALQARIPGFSVTSKSFPNYCTMIELDNVGDRLDRHYLHGLSTRPFCVAGAIRGDDGQDSARWFCAIGTKDRIGFSGTGEARKFLQDRCPRVLEFAGDEQVEAFAGRTCYHIGRSLNCSQLHGGKAVLIGDAAAPYPPIGQGVNGAMESAMVLDQCIQDAGSSPDRLPRAAEKYTERWKPEADAVSWISERSLFENRFHTVRALATSMLGMSIFEQAKSAEVPYSQVRRRAERLWPLWAR